MTRVTSIRWDRRQEVELLRYARRNGLKFSQAVRLLASKALRHENEMMEHEHREIFTAGGWR